MKKNKITLLGTGTCQIQNNRMASSILVEIDKLRFIYDLGRGITLRLNQLKLKQDNIEHIIFSHFHPDHISELVPYLHAARWSTIDPRNIDLHMYGPEGLKNLWQKTVEIFGEISFHSDKYKIIIHEIDTDTFFINNFSFISTHLPPFNNRGLKFSSNGKIYAFTGDSNFHKQEINFLKEVDIAIIDSGHISDEEIVELALATQVKTVICSHQYRDLNELALNQRAKKNGYKGKIVVGEDLMSFDI